MAAFSDGTISSRPTLMRAISKLPSGFFTILPAIAAPAFSSPLCPGGKRITDPARR